MKSWRRWSLGNRHAVHSPGSESEAGARRQGDCRNIPTQHFYSLPTRNNRHRINKPPINQLLIRQLEPRARDRPPPAGLRRRVRKTRPVSSAQEPCEPPPKQSDRVSRRQKRPGLVRAAPDRCWLRRCILSFDCTSTLAVLWRLIGFLLKESWADCLSVQA